MFQSYDYASNVFVMVAHRVAHRVQWRILHCKAIEKIEILNGEILEIDS